MPDKKAASIDIEIPLEQAEVCSEILKALGHPVRLQIIDILSRESKAVNELADILGKQQAIISQQLKILRLSGLVKSERQSGKAIYSLMIPDLKNLLNCLKTCKAHVF